MNVSACLVTRGNVDMTQVVYNLPADWEILVWDNTGMLTRRASNNRGSFAEYEIQDLSVYGRYAAIEHASHDLIYVQDDDVIVSDPQAIVDFWGEAQADVGDGYEFDPSLLWKLSSDEIKMIARGEHVVCNMPQEFRPHYPDSALVGFGAAFHRDAPGRAFERWKKHEMEWTGGSFWPLKQDIDHFQRTCDVVFTTLTPRVLVDVPKVNLPHATGDDRMYRQPEHVGERARMLDLARRVRES